jgi:two-component system phosphate regulon response regulator OmpR
MTKVARVAHLINTASSTIGKRKPVYVVIVEDDKIVADVLRDVFHIRGDRCFVIRSKIGAERFLQHIRPDLVVLDYQLIGGIGLQAARIASNLDVPVIVTSGYLAVSEKVRKAGFTFLPKPFTAEELLALASTLLGDDPSNNMARTGGTA